MNVTATARLTAEQCMERLAECPALPRGERLAAYISDMLAVVKYQHLRMWLKCFDAAAPRQLWRRGGKNYGWPHPERIRQWAAPVRRLREERRALREQLRQTGNYLMTITAEVVRLRAENNALKSALETLLTGPARNLDHIAEMGGHPKDDGGSVPCKRRRMKAARCQLCGFRLLDSESLLHGEGHHAVFCALTRSAVIFYVAAWPSGDRFINAAFMLDQAKAESPLWALAPPQQWRRL